MHTDQLLRAMWLFCAMRCRACCMHCYVLHLINYILCNTKLFCFVCGVQRNVHNLCSTEFCGALWLFCARLGCTLWVRTVVVLCNLAEAPWCALCNVAQGGVARNVQCAMWQLGAMWCGTRCCSQSQSGGQSVSVTTALPHFLGS